MHRRKTALRLLVGAAAFAGIRQRPLCRRPIQAQMNFVLTPDHTQEDVSKLACQICMAAQSEGRVGKVKGEGKGWQSRPSLGLTKTGFVHVMHARFCAGSFKRRRSPQALPMRDTQTQTLQGLADWLDIMEW